MATIARRFRSARPNTSGR